MKLVTENPLITDAASARFELAEEGVMTHLELADLLNEIEFADDQQEPISENAPNVAVIQFGSAASTDQVH